MVIPNVIALLALSGMVVNEVKTNGKRKSADETPHQALFNQNKDEVSVENQINDADVCENQVKIDENDNNSL